MEGFGYEIELTVRFRDLDAMAHVNNAVYATYLEHARLQYLEEVAGIEIGETGLTIVDVDLEFRRPIEWGDSVTVGVRVPEVGTSSMPIEYRIETDDGVAAEGQTTLVHVDRETGEAAPIPDDWRENVAAHENL